MIKLWTNWFKWLFPLYCAGCESEGLALCPNCEAKLEFCDTSSFKKLPSDLFFYSTDKQQNHLDGLAAIFVYRKSGTLSKLLHLYKYESMSDYGNALATLCKTKFPGPLKEIISREVDLITWIPLHRKKRRQRGFNQSQQLAFALPLTLPKLEILRRKKNTVAQMSLSRADRLHNVSDAFGLAQENACLQNAFCKKTLLLVDDVYTTGATLNAAAKVLKRSGAAKIYALVLARQEE